MNAGTQPPGLPQPRNGLLTRLALSPRFHRLAAKLPGLRHIARREGAALFSVMSGFVQSQTLMALVQSEILHLLSTGPMDTALLARHTRIAPDRLTILLQAGAALGLLRRQKADLWALSPRGAAFLAVPGLDAMVRHHHVLYDDLRDPLAFFRGEVDTGLANFWPYVFGALGQEDAAMAARYSRLMSESQILVAQDTLSLVDFSQRKHLLDVGGGTGAFLTETAPAHPDLALTLFDLPQVVAQIPPQAPARLRVVPGSFRTDPLPTGADTLSLVRVLYDHPDTVVRPLLRAAFDALPKGGMIVVSEPMSGGERPDPTTDVYFAIYTMAMRTGRTRSAPEIAALLAQAGFCRPSMRPGFRPFVTSVVTAHKA